MSWLRSIDPPTHPPRRARVKSCNWCYSRPTDPLLSLPRTSPSGRVMFSPPVPACAPASGPARHASTSCHLKRDWVASTTTARTPAQEGAPGQGERRGPDGLRHQPYSPLSFVPFYAQRLSSDCVLNGARGIQQTNNHQAHDGNAAPGRRLSKGLMPLALREGAARAFALDTQHGN